MNASASLVIFASLDLWYARHPFWISLLLVVIGSFVAAPFNEEIRNGLYRRPGRRLLAFRKNATAATIARLEEIASSDRALLLDLLETGAFQMIVSLGLTLVSAGLMSLSLSSAVPLQLQMEAFATVLLIGLVSSLLLTALFVYLRSVQLRRVQDSIARLKGQIKKMELKL